LIFAARVKMTLDKFVLDYDDGEIEISVGSIPVKEKANMELMQRISKNFNVKKVTCERCMGSTQKQK
jgi:uncharacterized protein YggU (UPF0235/DUF167 family)